MADSSTELATSTEPETVTADPSVEISSEEKAPESTNVEESTKVVSEDNSKVNNEVEEEEEYVLKDEAPHEEDDNQKEAETNGKVDEGDGQEQEGKDKVKAGDGSLGSTVAKHYNSIPETGKDARKQSRIFHLRNFNNWVKSVLINDYLEKAKKTRRRYDEEINVLDLGCGKGGDLLKWQKARVGHVICADIAETSVQQCKERYDNLRKSQRQGGYRESRERLFSIECIPADCTKVDLSKKFRSFNIQLDLSSCQFAFHYAFESYEQADTMLKNACAHLRPGGYFIGTTPDANELVKSLKKAEGNSFGNDVYNIEFENKEEFGLFGTKYHFKLQDVVDCPEFLVHFKTVEKLAEKYGMKLVYKKNFRDLFKEKNKDYGNLLHKMQALETYPPRKGWSLVSDKEGDYSHVKQSEEEAQSGGREKVFGTLTKDEWEAAGLYMAFAFEKIDTEEVAKQEQKEKAQKRTASSENTEEDSGPPAKRTRDAEAKENEGAESKPEETEETVKAAEDTEMVESAESKPIEAAADSGISSGEQASSTEQVSTEDQTSTAENATDGDQAPAAEEASEADQTPAAAEEEVSVEEQVEESSEQQEEKMDEDQPTEPQEEQLAE